MRALRRNSGLSQAELADALGVTFQQVQKYERGFNRISASRLFAAAKVLGVTPAALFDGLPLTANSVSDPLFELAALPEGGALARAFCGLEDAELRRGVLNFVQILADRH